MEVGTSVTVELVNTFVEGTLRAVAISDGKKYLYKVECPELSTRIQWFPADKVFQIIDGK